MHAGPTGCTVILTPQGALGGVDVRGASPGTRETELLSPLNAVEVVHAVLLAGGSAFGLDAAGGVMRWLDGRGIGVQVGAACVPIVPAAILFDLNVGDGAIRPDAQAGHAACEAASTAPPAEGNVGAGAGAVVGKLFGLQRAMKGGIGSASVQVGGITVGAIVAVNAVGDVVDPATGRVIAGARSADGRQLHAAPAPCCRRVAFAHAGGCSTTIGVVATDARITKVQANRWRRGARRPGTQHQPGSHPERWRTAVCPGTGESGLTATTVLGTLAAEVVPGGAARRVGRREPPAFRPAATWHHRTRPLTRCCSDEAVAGLFFPRFWRRRECKA